MNGGFVVDSSVAIAWVVLSQASRATDKLLDAVASGTSLFVPAVWPLEVTNSLLTLARRGRLAPEQCVRARLDLSQLSVQLDEESPVCASHRVWDLAEKYALSSYDVTYLEVAIRRDLPLASRDTALNRAAKRAGVRTLL